PDYHYEFTGVTADWPYNFQGFAGHWNKNTNLASAIDVLFLNLFPRATPFEYNAGGYVTLSFVPTLGTMILGLLAGCWLREGGPNGRTVSRLVGFGAICLAAGLAADLTGVCPSVKRIWTPAWVLYSGGWCFLILAGFSALLDTGLPGRWAFPLKVIGANSIAAYCLAHLIDGFIVGSFKTHLGPNVFSRFGP